MTVDEMVRRRAVLERERDEMVEQVNRRLSYIAGQIDLLTQMIEDEAKSETQDTTEE